MDKDPMAQIEKILKKDKSTVFDAENLRNLEGSDLRPRFRFCFSCIA